MYKHLFADTDLILPVEHPGSNHVYHLYVVRTKRRDELQTFLKGQGIGTLVHYPVPIHLQPAYRARLPGADDLPETERAAREVLSLPMYPELTESDVEAVAEAIWKFSYAQSFN